MTEFPFTKEEMKKFDDIFKKKKQFHDDCIEAQKIAIFIKNYADNLNMNYAVRCNHGEDLGEWIDYLYADKQFVEAKNSYNALKRMYYEKQGWEYYDD